MTTSSRETPLTFDPRRILFHGNGLLAVNKPAGVPVHSGTAHAEGLAEKIDAWVHFNPGVLDIRAGKPVFPVQHLDLEASGAVLVHGLEGLRVVDAAIMPDIIRANTIATSVMIGERVVEWVEQGDTG